MKRHLMLAAIALVPLYAMAAAQAVAPAYSLYFDWGKHELRRDDSATLDLVAEAWRGRPTSRLLLAGHTDRSGDPAANRAAGLRRAQLVAGELERRGIPRNAMQLVTFGEDRPQVPTQDGVREVQNRRVVITFEE